MRKFNWLITELQNSEANFCRDLRKNTCVPANNSYDVNVLNNYHNEYTH